MVRSDRGPEFRNHLLSEHAALIGMGQKFGAPWRPMEQGRVERIHQELQKLLGILVLDVVRCWPAEWPELLPVVSLEPRHSVGEGVAAVLGVGVRAT